MNKDFDSFGYLKWINGNDRQWDCPHVNKCDVIVDKDGYIYEWNTDLPEPSGEYRYIFLIDFIPELTKRPYIKCDCKKGIYNSFDWYVP